MVNKILLAVFLCCLFTISSYSQTAQKAKTGKIIGVVVSQDNGAIVQGVKIIIESKNFKREVMTDGEGRYEVEVPLGIYKITTEIESFRKFKRKKLKIVYPGPFIQNINLKFGKPVRFDKKALKELGF
jgi:ribosomal protein L24